MGRVTGSYESVVRGVSEQNPQARRSGQHFAQVNMISDPVRGLARRHGSILQHELKQGNELVYDDWLASTGNMRVFPFVVGAEEFDLIVRTDAQAGQPATFAWCFNKTTRQFIPVVLDVDAVTTALVEGGSSSAANVGRYVYIAGKTIIAAANTTDRWNNPTNKQRLAGWVRGGAYARTFKVTLTKSDNTTVSATYVTKAASYPGVLDTSDILTADPDYQKKVNDRTNDYNTAVTQWIGEAAQDITPENIVSKLMAALIVAGVSPGDMSVVGGYLRVQSASYKDLALDDSGDGSLVRNVANTVRNLDLVSSQHYVGKILKVEPEDNTGDPMYLEAFATDGVSTGWTDVVWRETAGFETSPYRAFCFATVQAGTFYISGSAAGLSTLSGVPDVPSFQPNRVGDVVSNPPPEFIGKTIDYLGVFQDRLLIGSGGNIFCSRPGDYLNWFRGSVLTLEDDDPASGFALGSEADVIRWGALYDRSLLLYGDRFQYVISGRTQITPTTLSIPVVSAYRDATLCEPKASGNFVFYAKYSGLPGRERTSLHQVQPGLVTDVADSYEASQQLDTYLAGRPVEILEMTAPNMVFLRTNVDRNKVFVYSYLDNPNTSERLYDSWSHWEWSPRVGSLIGLSSHKADMLFYVVKTGTDSNGNGGTWVACEQFVRDTDLSDYPYVDSIRPIATYYTPTSNTYLQANAPEQDTAAVAIGRGIPEQFLGDQLDSLAEFNSAYYALADNTYVGYNFPAYVTPTNPYVRDRNDQAILGGRLTLNKVKMAVTDTGGAKVTVNTRNVTRDSLQFTGRILGAPSNLIGRQPIVTTTLSAFIGGEVSECTYTVAAHNWLPLTVNSIEWQGQFFFNTRRV